MKFFRSFLVVSCLVVSLFGCGSKTDTTAYYRKPSWTKGGSLIFVKGLQSVSRDAIGSQTGSALTESVATIETSGAGETTWFDVSNAPPYALSCSPAPTFEYVAYLDGLNSGLFSKIVIRNIAAGTHSGLERGEILFSPGLKSFDWSKAGTKIVYCTTSEVRIRDWNDFTGATDALVTAESNLSFVSWKNGERIAFVRTAGSSTMLSLIYPDGSGRLNLLALASVDLPQISSVNTNEVFGKAGGSFCKVDVSLSTPVTSEILSSFTGELPRLSPAADKVTYSKTGEQSGIYILILATSTESKVK